MSSCPPLSRLIATLAPRDSSPFDPSLTGREIAEIIWWAQQTQGEFPAPESVSPVVETTTETELPESSNPEDAEKTSPQHNLAPKANLLPLPQDRSPSLAFPDHYRPIAVPNAPAIAEALPFVRALRPLACQVTVGPPIRLDEAATVEYIAETQIWEPVLKPLSELWLEVALVFDHSPSMAIWQQLEKELARLLSRYGQFRDLRLWYLRPDSGKLTLMQRDGKEFKISKPKELLTSKDRRLVVIVSDCVGAAWHNGQMRDLIALWSAQLPTVIFQVFPERLWSRTALARSLIVELRSQQIGGPSDRLKPQRRSIWDRTRLAHNLQQPFPKLPVISLEPKAFADLAALLRGKPQGRSLGIIWDAEPVFFPQTKPSPLADLQERLNTFMLLSSPAARQLATLLASAPVITLPIIRLIKQAFHLRASAVPMAEVLMSGLLTVSEDRQSNFENAERLAYQLVDPSVRERLRAGTRVVDAQTVLKMVSEYVARGLGKSIDTFWGLIYFPEAATSATDETAFLSAFAQVTANILRGLGTDFARLADQIDHNHQQFHQTRQQQAFLAGFNQQSCSVETANLVILDGEAETQFLALQQCFARFQLVDGQLYDLQQAALAKDARASFQQQVNFIFDQLALRLDLRQWSGETVFVNDRGQISERQSVTAFYQDLDLPWPSKSSGQSPPQSLTTIRMILVPAGTLRIDGEIRAVEPFFLAQTPITQAQWWALATRTDLQVKNKLAATPSSFQEDYQGISHWQRPVEKVSWQDAIEFCARLARLTQSPYCLPTELEWQYACYGLREPPLADYAPFHFGETLTGHLANYDSTNTFAKEEKMPSPGQTTPVGNYPPNAFGLQDLHGNVWEWNLDLWQAEGITSQAREVDFLGRNMIIQLLNESGSRVLRGGSWDIDPMYCRSADRYRFNPVNRYNFNGFRVACRFPSP